MQNQNASDKQARKLRTMTTEPVRRLIIRLAIPTMISMMITSIYNMADTFFVGQISDEEPAALTEQAASPDADATPEMEAALRAEQADVPPDADSEDPADAPAEEEAVASATSATAAVGVAFPLMAIIQAFGFMFGHGSGNFISRALGSRDTGDAEKMAATGFFMALIAGTLLMSMGLIFLDPLLHALGARDQILPYARDYIRLILIGCPWMTASLVLNNQLRFQGNALFAMIGIGTGGLINMGLDPLLIFGLGMGVSGAALATIISQFISFCLLWIGARKSDNLRIKARNFTPTPHFLKEIFKGGAPSLFRQGIGSIATACMNNAAVLYGAAAVAAMSVVSRIMMFANSLVIGFGQGFQPVCGFNYGSRRFDRVREGYFFCVKYSSFFLLGAAILGEIFAPRLIALFRNDPKVIEIGALALRLQCITLPAFGYIMISNMMMQTTAHTFQASTTALARQGLFFLPLVLVLPLFLKLLGIQIAQPIADAMTLGLTIAMQMQVFRKMRELERETAEGQ